MRTSPPMVILIGQTIADKYRVEGVLGRGAMGVVLLARHLGLEQLVAIKLLSNETAQNDAVARGRFLREARLAARIRSDHVCRVLDTGALEDGTPFLVMEYLEGVDLAEELASRGRIDPLEAAQYMHQACEALSDAHAAGVIHRDLKPANLFLTTHLDGSRLLKVLDFGVSKALVSVSGEAALTKTSSLIGSPLYMSPEQLHSSRGVDERSDIWSLGTILYELITGRPPFLCDTIPALVNGILNAEPPSFEALGISAPQGLELVILQALSKSREDRFVSANELALALAPFVHNAADSTSGVVWNRLSDQVPSLQRRSQAETQCSTDEDEAMASKPNNPSQPARIRRSLLAAAVVAALGVTLGVLRYGPSAVVTDAPVQPIATFETSTSAASVELLDTPGPSDAQIPLGELPSGQDALLPKAAEPGPPEAAARNDEAPAEPAHTDAPVAPMRAQPKAAAPRQEPARVPVKAVPAFTSETRAPSDALEIPGFGGRR